MFDTREEIRRQLEVKEDARAEFKEVELVKHGVRAPNTEDMAGEMVAFANAEGGTIFLGVDDDGVVRGLPMDRAQDVEEWVINVSSNNCDPPIRPLLRREQLAGPDGTDRLVILVQIGRGLYVHGTSRGRHLVRVGSTKQLLKGAALARLFQERGRNFVFDEQLVPTATVGDLESDDIRACIAVRPLRIPWQDLLRNTRVAGTEDGVVERPTVAGLLAFGIRPQAHLLSAFVEAAVYRGHRLTSDDLVHAESIKGQVRDQIDDAVEFVERFMLRPARKAAGRTDYPQYRIGAVHEAVVNAVAHRDYSLAGAKIRLFLFADRMELYSPGKLPNTLTIETMPYRVFARNQLLLSFLSRMTSRRTGRAFLESRGEGVRGILEESEEHSGRRPEYELFGEELRLTIWARPSPHDAGQADP